MDKQVQEIRFLDSRYRTGNSGDSPTNFNIDVDIIEYAKKLRIRQANIVSSQYDIDSRNNKLYFNDGSERTATIASGRFAFGTLAQAVEDAMNAVSSGYQVSFSTISYKMTISHGSSFTLQLSNTTNSIWSNLGFNTSADLVGTSHTGDGLANTSSLYYYVTLDCARNQKVSKDLPNNTCAIVHNTASAFGNLLTISTPFEVEVNKDYITNIGVKVYDNKKNLVDTQKINISLEVEFIY